MGHFYSYGSRYRHVMESDAIPTTFRCSALHIESAWIFEFLLRTKYDCPFVYQELRSCRSWFAAVCLCGPWRFQEYQQLQSKSAHLRQTTKYRMVSSSLTRPGSIALIVQHHIQQ